MNIFSAAHCYVQTNVISNEVFLKVQSTSTPSHGLAELEPVLHPNVGISDSGLLSSSLLHLTCSSTGDRDLRRVGSSTCGLLVLVPVLVPLLLVVGEDTEEESGAEDDKAADHQHGHNQEQDWHQLGSGATPLNLRGCNQLVKLK